MNVFTLVKEKLGKPYQDLEFLLHCFKEVLEELDETLLAQRIPWIYPKEGPNDTISDDGKSLHMYSICFQLLNIVEVNGAVQNRRNKEEQNGIGSINGLWPKELKDLMHQGISSQEMLANMGNVHIEPVLTAHPTEAKRPVVLEHYRQLYLLMVKRENQMYTSNEQNDIRKEIKTILHRLWFAGEIFVEKPDVKSELHNIIYYFRNVFPEVVPIVDKNLLNAWEYLGNPTEKIKNELKLPKISFGNWVGGDRDGHPMVSAEITAYTLNTLRTNAILMIKESILQLEKSLGIYRSFTEADADLQSAIRNMVSDTGYEGEHIFETFKHEVFRMFIQLIIIKLPIEEVADENGKLIEKQYSYSRSGQLLRDLVILRRSLWLFGAAPLANEDVNKVIRLVDVFGFHLARLDIRQNSTYNEKAVGQLIEKVYPSMHDYINWDKKQKNEFVLKELQSNRPFTNFNEKLDTEAEHMVSCFRAVREHIHNYGFHALGMIVVSMTRNVTDLYHVFLLQREAGLTQIHEEHLVSILPVVPLFETIDDLVRSPQILNEFLSHPAVHGSLKFQQKLHQYPTPRQYVMIGYSDSNKDGGIFASAWHLHLAQQQMIETGEKYKVDIHFFHGKGGTISRGAGPTHWFIKSLPHKSINGSIRQTEQGETIERKYANKVNAAYNLELLVAGAFASTLKDRTMDKYHHPATEIMDFLACESMKYYSELTDDEDFIEFYSKATPIDAIESSKIGSRPARRSGKRTLGDLRAIPWVFSWSQSRYHITSWYGVGYTLTNMRNKVPDKYHTFKNLIKDDPLIRYILTNVDTSLAATDIDIMKQYADLVENVQIREKILSKLIEEFNRTRDIISELLEKPMETRRTNHYYSTMLRAEPLKILHRQQVNLLKLWRQKKNANDDKGAEDTLLKLLRSVNAIANAMGNTG